MTAVGTQVNLGLRLLDDQLFDAEDHRCGRVDDIELTGEPGTRTEVSALLTGSAAWTQRLRSPFGAALSGLAPGYVRVIPWSEVESVSTAVHLAKTAEDLGLESDDGRNVQWMDALPRRTILVSRLLRSRAVGSSGAKLGRIWDVRAERQTQLGDERVNEPWRIVGLLVGRLGWRERIGVVPEQQPGEATYLIPWDSVQDVRPGQVIVSGR
jgi:sporulation protein YlmC with PRC-barrel domain